MEPRRTHEETAGRTPQQCAQFLCRRVPHNAPYRCSNPCNVLATGVIKDPIDFAVFCIAPTYMRLYLTHMLYTTQLYVLVLFVSRTDGVGGGWAWLHALSWHTCWMLRNCTYMFHATQLYVLVLFVSCTDGVGGGRGCMRCLDTQVGCYATAHIYMLYIATQLYVLVVVACVVLTHMLDATQLHIRCMLRNCMCSYCSYHARMGRMIDRHSSARQSLVTFEKNCAKKPVQ